MAKKGGKTLYFIDGMQPTKEQQEEADKMEGQVVFRNRRRHVPGGPVENFDNLAGDPPDDYKEVYNGGKDDKNNENVVNRPRPTRGTYVDERPGTIDTGKPAESGTGAALQPNQSERVRQPAGAGWPSEAAEGAQNTSGTSPDGAGTGSVNADDKGKGGGKK